MMRTICGLLLVFNGFAGWRKSVGLVAFGLGKTRLVYERASSGILPESRRYLQHCAHIYPRVSLRLVNSLVPLAISSSTPTGTVTNTPHHSLNFFVPRSLNG